MALEYLTLSDFDVADKRLLLRVDINVPLDPSTNQILDDTRIRSTIETLDALREARVVVISHQSRPGMGDFISLELHAKLLQKYCSRPVKFIDDVIGPSAREAIAGNRRGEILVLDNVRFCAEENIEGDIQKLIHTNLVKRLSPLFELYVNDAFAASHRAQASLVAFPYLLPASAGKLMEKELDALNRLLENPDHPAVYVLGGAKSEDKVPVIENILATERADLILVGGVVGKIFLKAAGFRFNKTEEEELAESSDQIKRARRILSKHRKKISMPSDFGALKDGRRIDIDVGRLSRSGALLDIGPRTAEEFSDMILKAKTVVANGPMGVFEHDEFETGTRMILEAMANSKSFTVVGGGHLAGYAGILGIADRISHISTAGGAMLYLLAGRELPAITALAEAAKRYRKKTV